MAFNLLRLTSGFAMLSLLAAPAACRKEGSDSGGGNGAATAFELEPSREGYFLLLKHTALEQRSLRGRARSRGSR